MIENLEAKLHNTQFLGDIDGLVVANALDYDPVVAAGIIIEKLLSSI